MSVFSAIFVLKETGTQSHSARFLNWSDHVNSVADLAASPPWCMVSKNVSIQPLLTLRISSYIHCALEENFSVTLKGYTCFTDLSKTTRALSRNYKRKVRDSATERFTRRTESMTDLKSGSNKRATML